MVSSNRTGALGVLITDETSLIQATITRTTHLSTASPGSNALAPPGSVGNVANRQAEPLLRRKDDLHVVETYPYDVDRPTLEEVCTAIRQLRNNRAPGEVGIPAEVYKTCLDSLGPWLHRVIT